MVPLHESGNFLRNPAFLRTELDRLPNMLMAGPQFKALGKLHATVTRVCGVGGEATSPSRAFPIVTVLGTVSAGTTMPSELGFVHRAQGGELCNL